MSSPRIEQLERTILDLGTEMYRLKSQISDFANFQDKFIKVMKGLKLLLDEKGVITKEDFEAAVELGEAINPSGIQLEAGLDLEALSFKKQSTH